MQTIIQYTCDCNCHLEFSSETIDRDNKKGICPNCGRQMDSVLFLDIQDILGMLSKIEQEYPNKLLIHQI